MEHLCTQETTISHISKTLDRMERSQEKLIELLETVSNQDARIENLEGHSKKCIEHADMLFERVRDLELNQATAPQFRQSTVDSIVKISDSVDKLDNTIEVFTKKVDKLNRFFYIATHKYAIIIYVFFLGLVLSGTILDLLNHNATIKELWNVYKGVCN